MKKIVCFTFILFATIPMFAQKTYTKEWKQVDSLLQLNLPQSAEIIINKIYQEAQAQNNVAQLVKAHLYRFYSLNLWEEESLITCIADTEEAIVKASLPAKNILHSIAAELYWRYYTQNRWQFHNRTALEVTPDDIRTWDLQRIVEKCVTHYTTSLLEPVTLQKTAIEPLSAMLEKQVGSEKFRPTLYDFLAFRIVEFFDNNVASLLQPSDKLSFTSQALNILQQIIDFHQHDPEPTALIDAKLQYLDIELKHATVPQKEQRCLDALQELDHRFAHHASSTEILFRIAKILNQQGKKRDAMSVIEKAIARFPKSFGAKNCLALKDEIKQPVVQLTADEATLPNKPFLMSVHYQNISTLHYKIIPVDYQKAVAWRENNSNMIDFYAKIKPVQSGIWTLPNSDDYQAHTIEMALPALKEGYYAIITSSNPNFSRDQFVSEKLIWVTNLSYIRQNTLEKTAILVLHRETGKPVSGVSVQEYFREYNYNKRKYETKYGNTYHSNAQGLIYLQPNDNYRSVHLYFTNGTDKYTTDEGISLYRNNPQERPYITTTFFTDRAIYRPGQTVWFKGLVLEWNERQAKIVEKRRQTVTFWDVNNQKVSELEVQTNEFGSFSGNFTIPANGLTGQMRLQGEGGSLFFRVEEYKRPKFEVQFEPVKDSYRLGAEIKAVGKATTYAGNAVSEAKVSYRVVRQALYPLWRWWWGPMPPSTLQEMVNGETVTKEDGAFEVSFTAIPDPNSARKEMPVFHYTVYATVSDITGETHETRTVIPVGYQSLMISAGIPEKMNIDEQKELHISATNLNGQVQAAKGTLTIWKLREPGRVLQERRWQRPDQFSMTKEEFIRTFPYSVYDNEDNVGSWEKEAQVCQLMFDTGTSVAYHLPDIKKWSTGKYIAELKTFDDFGEAVENSTIFTLFSTKQNSVPAGEPLWFQVENPTIQPGETVKILIGSAYQNVEAFYEITGKDRVPQSKSITLNNEQKTISIPVTEKERGNFAVQLYFVRNNRPYNAGQIIQVPYENKKLNLEFASFRDKLQPGQEEEWRITIKDKAGDVVAAELLASMYDASLDTFTPHNWYFFPWQSNYVSPSWITDPAFRFRQGASLAWRYERTPYVNRYYDKLINLEDVVMAGYGVSRSAKLSSRAAGVVMDAEMVASAPLAKNVIDDMVMEEEIIFSNSIEPAEQTSASMQIRTNFNETAFFYPQLRTNEKGETVIQFTIPEALTRWKMQGLAWTRDLKVGAITKELVTQKELMIFTNPPRFFRENDTIWFSAKLSNITDKTLQIKTHLQFMDALTGKPVTGLMLLDKDVQETVLNPNENKSLFWKMQIPEGLQAVTYRITANSEYFSDGEENIIPVLTNRMLVTESLPLPIRGNQTKSFAFTKLLDNRSNTLRNHSFTLEFTNNPAWNALQALPYMMEYPYECVEQTFTRYYANSIATHIVNSDPRIKQIFDIWRNYQPDALRSNLEKNQELKALLLEETPWVQAAKNESERKQRIAILFDLNRMSNEMGTALHKVEQAQLSNGGFPWFKGGPDNRFITQYIIAGIGHLQKMGIATKATDNMLRKAIAYMDARITEDLNEIKKEAAKSKADYTKEDHLNYLATHYLYTRSFYINSHPIPQSAKEAFDFYTSQATVYWTKQNNYLKGMIALALHRFDNQTAAKQIMQSLTETALYSDEMGMYWRNNVSSWWWYQAPIETQALMIEAYKEVLNDQKSVEELKIWLLKQKQTQDWKTTKATSEAVYALLLTGSNLLASDALCQITVGRQTIDPNKLEGGNRPEAGTGYFKTSWSGAEIKPDMGKITVKNPNPTIAWGAAYWQYFEQLDKITPAETNVSIKKQLFVKNNTPSGPILKEITSNTPIKIGDKITVRIEIRADRDMEYVHLKDMRAAAFEPVNVLSGYRWQDGLGYYESTRDASTNFFIGYLRKGTYVFEHELFATQQGEFSNGITTLQCMYAPEFTTHSEGIRVRVMP